MRALSIALTLSVACLALTACGGGASAAAAACEAAVAERMAGRSYQLDGKALAASARDAGEGITELRAPIVFDAGMTNEERQTVECRTRVDPGQSRPSVLTLNFIW